MGLGLLSAEERRLLAEVVERLGALPEGIRAAVADRAWAEVPSYDTEFQYLASLNAGVAMNVNPASENLFRVTLVLASVPSGATGTIALDGLTIPVPAGVTPIPFGPEGGLLLARSATRSLTLAGGNGAALLFLSGQILPALLPSRMT